MKEWAYCSRVCLACLARASFPERKPHPFHSIPLGVLLSSIIASHLAHRALPSLPGNIVHREWTKVDYKQSKPNQEVISNLQQNKPQLIQLTQVSAGKAEHLACWFSIRSRAAVLGRRGRSLLSALLLPKHHHSAMYGWIGSFFQIIRFRSRQKCSDLSRPEPSKMAANFGIGNIQRASWAQRLLLLMQLLSHLIICIINKASSSDSSSCFKALGKISWFMVLRALHKISASF